VNFGPKTLAFLVVLAAGACSAPAQWEPGGTRVHLSGADEVPPTRSEATGSGNIYVQEDGAVSGAITTSGVEGTAAHIHVGSRRQIGPIAVPLAKSGDTYTVPAGAKLDAEQLKAFREGRLYVNVHSERFKSGEIRGQLEP
jgi:CHRD domain-containing protein